MSMAPQPVHAEPGRTPGRPAASGVAEGVAKRVAKRAAKVDAGGGAEAPAKRLAKVVAGGLAEVSSVPAAGLYGSPARGRARQARGDSARETLLGAAERVFARAGFGGATTAAIAEAAGLPKANLHYHFGSKEDLYREVLSRTLHDWLVPLDGLRPEADPRQALEAYIRAKMAMSAGRPDASRVYANELLHGAPVLGALLRGELRRVVRAKAAVIDGWVAAGRMAPVDATQLFFTIWAATQTHADFDVQVRAVLGRSRLTARDHQRAADHVVALLLRGCGLQA